MFLEMTLPTIGVDYSIREFEIDGKLFKTSIWDPSGRECFRNVTTSYFRGCHCISIVFSVSQRQSFESVDIWMTDTRKLSRPDVFIVLIGTHCDSRDRKVTREEAEETARRFGIPYFETTATTTESVENTFRGIVTEGIRRIPNFFDPPSKSTTSASPKKPEPKKSEPKKSAGKERKSFFFIRCKEN
jgi:GTPase SAR1 family protein